LPPAPMRCVATSARNGSGDCTDSRSAASTRTRSFRGAPAGRRPVLRVRAGRSGSPGPSCAHGRQQREQSPSWTGLHPHGPVLSVPMRRRAPSGADYTENTSVLTRDGRGETPTRGGSPPCSNASPIEPAEWLCWRKKRRACSTTTTSGTEHILLGLIHEGEGVAAQGARVARHLARGRARPRFEEIIGHGGTAPSGHIPFTPRAKKVLELSLREALQLGHNYIGTEHILLGAHPRR